MTSHYSGFRNKRGFIGDILTLMIVMFILAVVLMSGYLLLSSVNTAFQSQAGISDSGKQIVDDATDKYISLWDGIFMFLLVGLSLSAAISAYFIDTHPIMFVLMLLVLAAFIFISASLANTYWNIESATAFSSFALEFKMMHYVMSKLPYYALIEGIIIMVALFAKVGQ